MGTCNHSGYSHLSNISDTQTLDSSHQAPLPVASHCSPVVIWQPEGALNTELIVVSLECIPASQSASLHWLTLCTYYCPLAYSKTCTWNTSGQSCYVITFHVRDYVVTKAFSPAVSNSSLHAWFQLMHDHEYPFKGKTVVCIPPLKQILSSYCRTLSDNLAIQISRAYFPMLSNW